MKIFFLRDSLLFFCVGIALLLGFSRTYSMRPAAGVIGECGSIGDADGSEHGNARYDDSMRPTAGTLFFSHASIEILDEIFKKLDRSSLVRIASVCKNCVLGAQFVLKIQEKERLLEKYDGDMQRGFFDAAAKGLTRLLPFLISIEGIDVNGADNFGDTALHHAKNVATINCLVALGANLDKSNNFSETPLISAAYGSGVEDLEKVKRFVELGVSLDCKANPRRVVVPGSESCAPLFGYDDCFFGYCTVFEIAASKGSAVTSSEIKDYLLNVSRRRQSTLRGEDASEKSDF